MSQSTYHSLRLKALHHGKALCEYGRKMGVKGIGLNESLMAYAAPSLVAVVGNRDSGKSILIEQLADLEDGEFTEVGTMSEYRFLHHNEYPPLKQYMPQNSAYIASESSYLRMLSFVELRLPEETGVLPVDRLVTKAEGIVFVIDALDPWSGPVWRHFENYAESHAGRIMVCVSKVNKLHKRDSPVLRRHLEERLNQLSKHPLKVTMIDYDDLFTFEALRNFLENAAVGERSWEGLRSLRVEFKNALEMLEASLTEQREWLADGSDKMRVLKTELFELRQRIRLELLHRIDTMGSQVIGSAEEILEEVRGCLTLKSYLQSIFGKSNSLDSMQKGLEDILSDALYKEIGGHFVRTNDLIGMHAEEVRQLHPDMVKLCPELKNGGYGMNVPFTLERETISHEIRKVLRQLEMKRLFYEALTQIDQITNARISLGMVMLIFAGIFGALMLHGVGITFVVLGLLCMGWGIFERKKELDKHFDFVEEWFLGVGARMQEPIDVLSSNLVNQAVDTYGEKFAPYFELVLRHKEVLPKRLSDGQTLYKHNRELIQELTV